MDLGSFTGLRIGIATVKAFADSKNIPVVAVNSLEALAYQVPQEGFVCPCVDAKNGNLYTGLFQKSSDLVKQQSVTFLSLKDKNGTLSNQNLIHFLEAHEIGNSPIYFVGDGSIVFKDFICNCHLKNNNKIQLAPATCSIASSISIAKIGYTKYKNGNYGNSDILSPLYLRKSQAELSLEQNTKF